jgi:hypothetical protein
MAMTHDAVAAIRQLQVLLHGDKGIGFGDQHLSQHRRTPSLATSVRGSSMASGRRNGMTVVSLDMAYRSFRKVLAGLTPASIRRLQSNVVTQIPA